MTYNIKIGVNARPSGFVFTRYVFSTSVFVLSSNPLLIPCPTVLFCNKHTQRGFAMYNTLHLYNGLCHRYNGFSCAGCLIISGKYMYNVFHSVLNMLARTTICTEKRTTEEESERCGSCRLVSWYFLKNARDDDATGASYPGCQTILNLKITGFS